MKNFMIIILALVPFGMIAQSSQEFYASADDVLKEAYPDLRDVESFEEKRSSVSSILNKPVDDDFYEVSDLLLADPDFEVEENMVTYTKDQKTVFFSANKKIKTQKENQTDVKVKNSVQLQLFKARVTEDGTWVDLEMLPFNGKKHSTGHPSLNKDDTKLYFVSDGPESTGKTDIFVVDLLEDGTYGKPQNMGSTINSMERELFPYVDKSDVLYFASDIQTSGEELSVFASVVIDNRPTAPVKLDVKATDSKEDFIAAFNALDAGTIRLAEEAQNLKDLEILLEAESLAEVERVEEELSKEESVDAYDFENDNVVYTVQIGAFLKNVKTGTYDESSNLFNYRYKDGYNRFYSGVFKTNAEAQTHLKQMINNGHSDAFILCLKGKDRFLPE